MGDRGYLSGCGCHIEYHTVDPKKPKAADCVYLDKNRICNCKKSPWYTEKCFVATSCTFRVKSTPSSKTSSNISSFQSQPKLRKKPELNSKPEKIPEHFSKFSKCLSCPYPIGTVVRHSAYGKGRLIQKESNPAIITIQFSAKTSRFSYPDCFESKHLMIIPTKNYDGGKPPQTVDDSQKLQPKGERKELPYKSARFLKHHFRYMAPYEIEKDSQLEECATNSKPPKFNGSKVNSARSGSASEMVSAIMWDKQVQQCHLIPYDGRLRDITAVRAAPQYIPIKKGQKEILLPVSVIGNDIYIMQATYEKYKTELLSIKIEFRKK